MRKKIALVLTSLLMLTVLLTTPYFTPTTMAQVPEPMHWKIVLAQKNCWAKIVGNLTDRYGDPLPGTYFSLVCKWRMPPPEPLTNFVFAKVKNLTGAVYDVWFTKWIDINKDGVYEIGPIVVHELLHPPTADEPHVWYEDVEEFAGNKMVVVEVHDTETTHEWQVQIKQHNCTVRFYGWLTQKGVMVPGSAFDVTCKGKPVGLQCYVFETPMCWIPDDIHYAVVIDGTPYTPPDESITQFPWTWWEIPGAYKLVELEITEVQMHTYTVMSGSIKSDGQLGTNPKWDDKFPFNMDNMAERYAAPVPFATRWPSLTPLLMKLNITFTQKDPITGIVKLGVPTGNYVGLDHWYFSFRIGTYFRVRTLLPEQGVGWLFTGEGKDPVLANVDYKVFNNYSGVYTFGLDGLHTHEVWNENTRKWDPPNDGTWNDDVLLAGPIDPSDPAYPAVGGGPPLAPGLQDMVFRGLDGIPGTDDDMLGPIHQKSTADPRGSSILYLPGVLNVTYISSPGPDKKYGTPDDIIRNLFASFWPQLYTTGTGYDKVIEGDSWISNQTQTATGQRWEFISGTDVHGYLNETTGDPIVGPHVPWKNLYCNAYVTYGCAWSVLKTTTDLGSLDVVFSMVQRLVRNDCLLPDINGDEVVDMGDIVINGVDFGANDEGFVWLLNETSGDYELELVMVATWQPPIYFNAAGDLATHMAFDARGLIDMGDIVKMTVVFGDYLTDKGKQKP